jgi:hypothetical protein
MKTKSHILPSLCGLLLLNLIPLARATIIVIDFGGDMVSANQQFQAQNSTATLESTGPVDFNGDGFTTGRFISRALDLNTPWLATSANYTGPSFFGGISIWDASPSGGTFRINNMSVIHNVAGDYLRPTLSTGDSTTIRASAILFLFEVPNGQFQTGDALTHLQSGASGTGSFSNRGRFVVRSNGEFYVSETNAAGDLGTIDPSAVNWAVFRDVDGNVITQGSTNLLLPGSTSVGGSLNFNVAGSTLDSIDFLGYIGTNTAGAGSTATSVPSIGTFTYVAIPEPSTLVLVSVVGLASLGFLRRKRGEGPIPAHPNGRG